MTRIGVLLLLLTAPVVGADAPPPLPCMPSAACALQMTRDAALKNIATTRDQVQLELSLKALAWSGKFDSIDDPELRARIAAMAKQVAALPVNDQNYLSKNFAAAMAAYGFVDEAQAMIAGSRSPKWRDLVRPALACSYARRGDFREAFAELTALDEGLAEFDAFEDMADCVARTAQPELARAATRHFAETRWNAYRIARMVALTELEAGHHAVAREAALSIGDQGWRANTLFKLVERYQRDANYPEALATERLLLIEARRPGGEQWLQYALRNLLADLMNSHAHAEIPPLLDQFPADDRTYAFLSVLRGEDDPGIIRAVAQRMPQLSSSEQKGLQTDLLLARVHVGDLKAVEALGLASDQQDFAKQLILLAGGLGAEGKGLARDVFQAAIAAKGKRPNGFWTDIAWAQARLGLLDEAHRTVERKIRSSSERGFALLGVAAAEAAQGNAQDAARSRARAAKLLKSRAASADDFYVAYYLKDANYPEAAQQQVLAVLEYRQPPPSYEHLPQELVAILARHGDLKRAMELANACSSRFAGTPEPFADVYSAANRLPNMIIRHWVQ